MLVMALADPEISASQALMDYLVASLDATQDIFLHHGS